MKFDDLGVLNLYDLVVLYFANLGVWNFADVVVCESLPTW